MFLRATLRYFAKYRVLIMIDANDISVKTLGKVYDFRSHLYDKTVAVSEFEYHQKALNKISWEPHMRVLEIATGPGRVLAEIARRVQNAGPVYGIDISPKMLNIAKKRMMKNGYDNVVLEQGDCRQLPWQDNYFDVLYNGYMMDLIPTGEMEPILKEMYRVLKPGGKLIMVNMSKSTEDHYSFLEQLYQCLPKFIVLHIMGNCRPVLMEKPVSLAGFINVEREYLAGKHPTEIILASKVAVNA